MPSTKELQAEIDALRAELAAKAKPRSAGELTIQRSAKGAVSVYGLQRWPVTLYQEQWQRLAAGMPNVIAFISAHKSELSTKPVASAATAQAEPAATAQPTE